MPFARASSRRLWEWLRFGTPFCVGELRMRPPCSAIDWRALAGRLYSGPKKLDHDFESNPW